MNNCFYPANILLPDLKKTDGSRWAVIACDQFTSEPEYWDAAESYVGDAPSALRLILPEVRLDKADECVPVINKTMYEYLDTVLREHPDSMIFVERDQPSGGVRRGIVGMVDLECYDYKKETEPLIRATEGTVLERIPPRVAVRRGAPIELPHVMLLIDDPEGTVIEPLINNKEMTLAYDFDMMLGGGHIKGQFLTESEKTRVTGALESLVTPEAIEKRYGGSFAPLLFAVGDGNHSLASAKAFYEEIKAEIGADAAKDHPARYALAEVVNLHDPALEFEPIYRVVFGVEPETFIKELTAYCDSLDGDSAPQTVKYVYGGGTGEIVINKPCHQLTVGTLQTFIDGYIKENPTVTVDYIHGEDSTEKLARRDGAIGFIFDGMGKDQLFKSVMLDGALPRKTFSMGHARDKRYYVEARKIK